MNAQTRAQKGRGTVQRVITRGARVTRVAAGAAAVGLVLGLAATAVTAPHASLHTAGRPGHGQPAPTATPSPAAIRIYEEELASVGRAVAAVAALHPGDLSAACAGGIAREGQQGWGCGDSGQAWVGASGALWWPRAILAGVPPTDAGAPAAPVDAAVVARVQAAAAAVAALPDHALVEACESDRLAVAAGGRPRFVGRWLGCTGTGGDITAVLWRTDPPQWAMGGGSV